MLGASIDVRNVYNLVSSVIHSANHLRDGVLVRRAANGGLDEEDIGLAQQIGSTSQNLEVEALRVDFDYRWRRGARCGNDFI